MFLAEKSQFLLRGPRLLGMANLVRASLAAVSRLPSHHGRWQAGPNRWNRCQRFPHGNGGSNNHGSGGWIVLNPSKRWFNVILIDLIDVLSWSLWNLHPLCKNSSDWPMVQGLKCVGDRPQLGRLWTTHHWRLPSGYLALCPRRSPSFLWANHLCIGHVHPFSIAIS